MKNAPHGFDEFGGETPIAVGIDVAQEQFVLEAKFYFCGSEAYFSRNEVFGSSGAFVIEADGVAEEQAMGFPVDFHELIREGFARSVLDDTGNVQRMELTMDGLLRVDGLLPNFFEPQFRGVRYT